MKKTLAACLLLSAVCTLNARGDNLMIEDTFYENGLTALDNVRTHLVFMGSGDDDEYRKRYYYDESMGFLHYVMAQMKIIQTYSRYGNYVHVSFPLTQVIIKELNALLLYLDDYDSINENTGEALEFLDRLLGLYVLLLVVFDRYPLYGDLGWEQYQEARESE